MDAKKLNTPPNAWPMYGAINWTADKIPLKIVLNTGAMLFIVVIKLNMKACTYGDTPAIEDLTVSKTDFTLSVIPTIISTVLEGKAVTISRNLLIVLLYLFLA
ncbi:hypothetical protein BsIDN1_11040 [Bacillus safensis]|uniref:Uncharacterized protein n=1 Tax=Bacillus safensis TaxID=561879 RepID=A0A5S9M7I1_BACIA|nr:hypothetical protein BsIDN1_11040 [Bacillus safensis]